MPELIINLVELLVFIGIAGSLLSQSVRIVREYQRPVLFRLGKCIGPRGPGPAWLIPFVDRPVLVDQRELFLEVPHQSCITQDNVPIKVDFLILGQIGGYLDHSLGDLAARPSNNGEIQAGVESPMRA